MAAQIPDAFVSDDEEAVHLSRRQRDTNRNMLQPFNHHERSWSERTQRKFRRECNALLRVRCLRRSERIALERFRNRWRFRLISVVPREEYVYDPFFPHLKSEYRKPKINGGFTVFGETEK